jgi:23S rRNA (cytosine1962-C5)-methyltransferase
MPENNKGPLRVRLSATAESIVRQGHPWIYDQSIKSQSRAGEPGDLAVVYGRRDKFLAVGLYDPGSPLRIRVLHAGKPRPIDSAFWTERLKAARLLREAVRDAATNGLRLVNGENDGLPGFVLDQYAETAVLKLYTSAWFAHLQALLPLVRDIFAPESIVLRLSRNIRDEAKSRGIPADGTVVFGKPLDGPVVFLESGLRFYADVLQGQKTGFFLDQRENRRRVETLSRGRSVLNAFSFTGGFSLYAARGGALSVDSLDISSHALAELARNWELNPGLQCRSTPVQADAFEWLARPGNSYDLVIIDPPSLAKRESERAGALKSYEHLAGCGIARLNPGGILVSCSCSAHVSEEEFFKAVRSAARASGRAFREFLTTGHAPDHPAAVPELRYLKALYLQES